MTTIIYKDGLLAADTQMSIGGMRSGTIRKVHKAGKFIVGFCGEARCLHPLINALYVNAEAELKRLKQEADAKEGDVLPEVESVPLPEGDYSAICIDEEGRVLFAEGGEFYIDFADDPQDHYAAGSGSPYALAALDAGLGIIEAMKIAIGRDCYSGGDVHVMNLKGELQTIPKHKFIL